MTTPTPNYVQIPPNSTGLKIRTVEVTDSAGNTVECQAIIIADPSTAANLGAVTSFGALAVDVSTTPGGPIVDTLNLILLELRAQNYLLTQLNNASTDDPETLRASVSTVSN